jgi:dienelactone hydrolase
MFVCGLAASSLLVSASAHAGASAAQKCESSKLKAAGKACDCRHGAAAKALLTGDAADFTKCSESLTDAFAGAEDKAGGACPNASENTTVDTRLSSLVTAVSTALGSGSASGSEAVKCVAAKLKAAGKKCACMHKAQAKAALHDATPDFTKCDAKIDAAYAKAEESAAGACPTIGDAEAICDVVQDTFDEVEADIANLGTDDFAAKGPYGVGVKTFTFVDSSRPTMANGSYPGAPDRTLVTEVWYPTDPSNFQPETPNEPLPETGVFPLMVRAHGFSGFRRDSKYLVQHLASWGYIVVAPDFPLSNLNSPGGPTLGDVGEQALDLSFLIDTFTTENTTPASFFFGRIDTDTIGAIGHSLGGATVLLATYHPTIRDARIDATVALSPLACVFLDNFYDNATTPLMIEGGTVDMITPYTSNQSTPYGLVNAPKYLLSLDGGTHLGFADRLGFGAFQNGDDVVGCTIFVGPGDPRPVTIDPGLPPDYLGGPAAGVDPSGSMCEPICPNPPPSFMVHARQNILAKASSVAFFAAKLHGSVAGERMITDKLDSENTDAALAYEE